MSRTGAEFRRAVTGDAAAFAAFLARYERRIARIIRALVPAADAEDVFQEVCLRLLAKGRSYDASRPLEPWLDQVTRNVCHGALRRAGRKREGPVAAITPEPADESAAAQPWVTEIVHGYLNEVGATAREALRLVLLGGLTQREAAKRLDVPPGTVAGWLAKAVRALRRRIGDR